MVGHRGWDQHEGQWAALVGTDRRLVVGVGGEGRKKRRRERWEGVVFKAEKLCGWVDLCWLVLACAKLCTGGAKLGNTRCLARCAGSGLQGARTQRKLSDTRIP